LNQAVKYLVSRHKNRWLKAKKNWKQANLGSTIIKEIARNNQAQSVEKSQFNMMHCGDCTVVCTGHGAEYRVQRTVHNSSPRKVRETLSKKMNGLCKKGSTAYNTVPGLHLKETN
jgi:hypothetical protein